MHSAPHCSKPASQVTPHLPEAQLALPPGGPGQSLPQPPQCSTSTCASTHEAPHWVSVPQPAEQAPTLQTCPVGQIVPHPPQLAGSVFVFTQPSAPQLVKPPSQVAPHLPASHVGRPFGTAGHCSAQSPQLSGSVLTARHETSHSLVPVPHTSSQAPSLHSAVPPTGELHSALQAPQFLGSAAASTSQPLAAFPSQSRLPSLQTFVQ